MKNNELPVSGARRALRREADMARRHEIVCGAPLRPEIAILLENYVPRAIRAADWERVRPEVHKWFLLASPTDRQIALRLLLLFARYALWAEKCRLPLDPNLLFSPTMIDRYFDSVRATGDEVLAKDVRCRFRRFGPVVGDPADWPLPAGQIARTNVYPPLTPAEEQLALKVARTWSIDHFAFCVLGFGFGLDGRWMPHVSAHNVVTVDGWPHLNVPDPDARLVPVLARYRTDILELVDEVPEGRLIGGERNVQNRSWVLARRIAIGEDRRLFIGEMRSTWFAAHLRNNTDLVYLSQISGRKSFQRLLELLEHVEPRHALDAARHARKA